MRRGNWRSRGRHRQQQRRHRSAHNAPENSSHQTEGGTSRPSGTSSSVHELPGFYFDPEKNRYFRLLPGHNNCNPLTRERLQKEAEERKRAALLAEDDGPKKKTSRTVMNSTMLLQKKPTGLLPPSSYCRRMHEVKVCGMQRRTLEIQRRFSSPAMDNFQLLVGDSTCERLFTVNDVPHGGFKYGVMNFGGLREGSLTVELWDNLLFTNRKVNSASWANVTHTDSHILLCLIGFSQTSGYVSLLPASLFSDLNPDQPEMRCSFKISTAWSCAWCRNPQVDNTFSTGLSRGVVVTDAVTGRKTTYMTCSDVLVQQFATRSPVLFNGCRSGEIFSIDLRHRDRDGHHGWKSIRFHQESAITALQLLQDENYLIAADMLGQIKLWDVRARRSVRHYEGHHNEYAFLPLHVNEPEGLLLAVGQDCYTRLWSLSEGHLLRTIPSPHPAAKDAVPNVVFSSQLGGSRGLPGLVMAVQQDLYHYSYNKDDGDEATP